MEELIAATARGDAGAFAALYRRHPPRVVGFAIRATGDPGRTDRRLRLGVPHPGNANLVRVTTIDADTVGCPAVSP
jgi:hypothetical protein